MRLTLRDNLPFVSLHVAYRGDELEIADILVDTGSGGTMLAAESGTQPGGYLGRKTVTDSDLHAPEYSLPFTSMNFLGGTRCGAVTTRMAHGVNSGNLA